MKEEKLIETKVTYTLELEGELILITGVPARVNPETGEQFFSPETVERLQQIVWKRRTPNRYVQVPVYEFV
ncbi:MAG: YgiT-type zinc finger protein [Bellilinea sp.]|nr:YgiT-type zinc finger protein [Bellilinea sp.]